MGRLIFYHAECDRLDLVGERLECLSNLLEREYKLSKASRVDRVTRYRRAYFRKKGVIHPRTLLALMFDAIRAIRRETVDKNAFLLAVVKADRHNQYE